MSSFSGNLTSSLISAARMGFRGGGCESFVPALNHFQPISQVQASSIFLPNLIKRLHDVPIRFLRLAVIQKSMHLPDGHCTIEFPRCNHQDLVCLAMA